ncbi:MAG: exodeoxyribonuclease III [Spirulinaceae cyanobacterium]
MKIASWNVNSIRARQELVIDWLKENPIDILCLQETKVIDKDFPQEGFLDLGYQLYISGQKAYNGVAIFSKSPLKDVISGFTPIIGEKLAGEFDEQKRVITGTINNIRVVNLYVPNGSAIASDKYDYKLRWLKTLQHYLQTLKERNNEELCVCGDFNVALEDRDIHDPKNKEKHIMSSPSEREALQEMITSIELKDSFRKFTSETGYYSWWDYRTRAFSGNRGWRIDHLYLTPNLYEQAVSCTIDLEPRKLPKPSDHTPVIVEI